MDVEEFKEAFEGGDDVSELLSNAARGEALAALAPADATPGQCCFPMSL